MGLCDLSLASPLLSIVLDGRMQTIEARTQLMEMNHDCMEWLQMIEKDI